MSILLLNDCELCPDKALFPFEMLSVAKVTHTDLITITEVSLLYLLEFVLK